MEVIRILLSLCSSAAAVFAIALACQTSRQVDELKELLRGDDDEKS